MSDYTQITDFSAKDALATSDPEKIILGSDVDAELEAIATAIATKLNSSGYTAPDVLTKLLTVDGAGSNLDADNVDGVGPFAVGTFSPTDTAVANITNVTTTAAFYARFGSIVLVAATLSAQAAASGAAAFRLTLPVASLFTTSSHAAGVGMLQEGTGYIGATVVADATNDELRVDWIAIDANSKTMLLVAVYRVL